MSATDKAQVPSQKLVTVGQSAPRPDRVRPNPIEPGAHYHRTRKIIHLICVCLFFTFPLTSLMRFDIPHQRFYFFGYELWINEFVIVFFSLMFMMFVIAAMAMIWGRVYCGYLCPQMIFSEASLALESKITRTVNKYVRWDASKRKVLSKSIFFATSAVASTILAFGFIAYFVEPRDLLRRLLSLDIQTAGGFAGAVTTFLTLIDFLFVRQRFCTTVCPYGYLQGMLGDNDTLIVQYRDPNHSCIECKKCVRDCHMGIDIRTSPYQIECIHCGECIDACTDVLARLGQKTLIHYVWGENGEKLGEAGRPWYQRIGIRDSKRVVVLLIIVLYGTALFTALAMRRAVMVQVAPVRTTLYRKDADGTIYNTFRVKIANRSRQQQTVVLEIEDLPGTHFASFENAIVIGGNSTIEREFEIAAPNSARLQSGVNHFRLISRVGNDKDIAEETFITPSEDVR